MAEPLFSIIIAVFNGGKTIRKALDSIESQVYKKIEIVVIDGGSKDNTLRIVQEYKQVEYWVSEPDKGIYDAMNKGIANAKGDWIYFLGSDDYLYNDNVLQVVAKNISSRNCELLYGNVLLNNKVYDGVFSTEKILRENISHQAIFYKRDVFEKLGNYSLRYKTHADWEFNIRCFFSPEVRVNYLDLVIAFFSFGGASSSHDVACLREIILPKRIQLHLACNKSLTISLYDEWWRLLRNAKIKKAGDLAEVAAGMTIPRSIKNMVAWQSRIPEQILHTGFMSKILMSLSYIQYLFNKRQWN